MILTGEAIKEAIHHGEIIIGHQKDGKIIQSYDEDRIGANSYDVCLANTLLKLDNQIIDVKKKPTYTKYIMPDNGLTLTKGQVYLGVTTEIIGSNYYVPIMCGKSSMARLGVEIHITAGFGDVGFINHWTLEIRCAFNTILYPGMKIAQIYFNECKGEAKMYNQINNSKYTEIDSEPGISQMNKNF